MPCPLRVLPKRHYEEALAWPMLEPRRTTQATAPLVLEAAPRPPDALGPSEPAILGPSPAPGAKYKMRSVTTRTFQPSTEPPTSYFSAEPWKIQEREHRAKDESQLFASFRRRTITNIDCQTRRACLPPTPGRNLVGGRWSNSKYPGQQLLPAADTPPGTASTDGSVKPVVDEVCTFVDLDFNMLIWEEMAPS
ncbi:hypothetical protein HPB52_021076 [Rhipicephalus sanguineus]|uniref:Uncharacterized protein n=1 Tax=Rhipicephalus sanguineus TaxID=34632 RepID=A0A9D4T6F8_RHISA|nr:hypothetical protein HPB52_021076 [Rhipicephalus sanguineus]